MDADTPLVPAQESGLRAVVFTRLHSTYARAPIHFINSVLSINHLLGLPLPLREAGCLCASGSTSISTFGLAKSCLRSITNKAGVDLGAAHREVQHCSRS